MFAASAAALALLGAAPVDVGRVGLGSSYRTLISSPDGGVWVSVDRTLGALARGEAWHDAIARASVDNRYRAERVGRTLSENGALGPDGQAWFIVGSTLYRSDNNGNVTHDELSENVGGAIARGPDGTLWSAQDYRQTLSRIDAQRKIASAPRSLPACPDGGSRYAELETAADGAVWILDDGTCRRLLRIAPDGSRSVFPITGEDRVEGLTADRSGGMWFSGYTDAPWIGHVDNGTFQRWALPGPVPPTGIAVAPDGAAYLASGRCELTRVAPDGTLSFHAAPIPARQLAFDPAGGLWLASSTRLVHAPPPLAGGACDDTPPKLRLSPGLRRTVRLARLRRGVRITVREPATIVATGDYGEDDHDSHFRLIHARRGGTYVFRLPRSALNRFGRELAAGDEPYISLYVEVTDRDGNLGRAEQDAIRVTR